MNSLSVCLIVKNEEKYLDDALKSIADIADQIVIVDTGSTDRTLEIAQSYQAEIHHFEWISDFAAARNESIKYASGDWIFWIDADERLTEASIPLLRKLLKFEKKPVIYTVRIKNIKEDGLNYSLSDAHRLFTNHRGIQFSGKIHEQVSPSAKKHGAEVRSCALVLDHLGYSFTGEAKAKKQERNRKILKLEVEEHPQSAYAHYTLAHNYKEDGENSEAEKHYKIARDLNQFDSSMKASLFNSYADTLIDLGRIDEAESLVKKSLSLHTLQNAGYFLQYRLGIIRGKKDQAIQALMQIQNQSQQIKNAGSDISTDLEIDSSTIWSTLGELYLQTEQWVKAAEVFENSLRGSGDSAKVLRSYFKVLERLEDWPTALDVLGRLIKLEGELPTYIAAIGAILIRMGEFEAALHTYLNLNHLQPDDQGVRRKIASLYAKLGDVNSAEEWLN